MNDQANDKPTENGEETTAGADAIRDQPGEFGQSSDYVQTGTVGRYAGGGPGDASQMAGRHGQGNNAGEQAWQNPQSSPSPLQDRSQSEEHKTADDPHNVGLTSRSADPGQSSYGGFSGEGTSPSDQGPKGEDDETSD